MFNQLLSKTGVLFIVLLIGALARYKKILDEDSTKALAKLVLVVALPFLYFYSLATDFNLELLKAIWILPFFAVGMVAAGYVAAKILSRFVGLESEGKATFVYLATFTNCGFLAIPIVAALYGSEGIIRVVFFNVGFNLLYWTLGVWTLKNSSPGASSGNQGKRAASSLRNLMNSGTIGLISGVIVGLAAVKLPVFLLESTKILGSATIPLALIVVGSIMSKCDLEKLRSYRKPIILLIFCRLIFVPALVLFISGLFGFLSPLSRAVIVLQSAMPSASTTPIFTARFGGDSQFASVSVFVTHILSVITIPIFMSLI